MQFQILGPLRVTNGDESEIALGGAKPAAVLAMLLLRPNELVPADRLIEDLWEGDPPPTAAKTLQVHMSRLRRALGEDPIETTSGGYVLHVAEDQIDITRFERLVSDARTALTEGDNDRASGCARAALALWRGDTLADFRYASFAQDTIARLDGLRIVALESAVEAELALGRHAELIPELKFLVKRHPLSEHLRAQMMLALYRSGRQAEALGVYRTGRRILVDQLGIEPGEELRAMEAAILAQDAQLLPPEPVKPAPERDRSSRGTLVGYDGELSTLEDLLEDAVAGRGRVALVSGDPGAGKSRLADELSSVARARRARVVWGRCRSGGGAPAYWPWVQALRALGADLPELEHAADADDARFFIFDAVARSITDVAANGPLVIVLDDLHAADQSTLDLLEFAGPAILDAPVLVLGTYRDTDADLQPNLRHTVNELARTTDCTQLVLTGLSEADTAHFVEVSAGVAPMPRLAAAIHRASGGNPLFVTELVRLLRAEGRLRELADDDELELPRGVEQVIARRLERLSAECRQTLATAAVIGREFELSLLERASGLDGQVVLRHLDDAIAARVVELATAGSFRISHDLVRQAIVSSLGETEQREAHLAVAEALERMHGARLEPVVAALAHHYASALPLGDAHKAIDYLTRAGEAAADVSALHEAADYYQRAAELGRASGLPDSDVCDLYVRHAEQLVFVGAIQEALAAVETAEALAAAAPDEVRDGHLKILRIHTRMLDALSLDEDAVFEVIDMFQQRGDAAGEARAWGALVTINCGRSNRLEGEEAAERMLDCARRAGSKALVNHALRGIGSNFALGGVPVAVAIPRLRSYIAEADDPVTKVRLMNCLSILDSISGRFDEARALAEDARRLCPPRYQVDFEGYVSTNASHIEYLAGNYARAAEHARASVASLERQGMVRYLSSEACFLVDALIELGDFDEAQAWLDRAAPWAADDDFDALLRQARSRARLARAKGDLASAEEHGRRALAHATAEGFFSADESAETRLVLAQILRERGAEAEACAMASEALTVADERGHVVFAEQAREFLAAPAAVV